MVRESGDCIKCCFCAHPKIRKDSKEDVNACNFGWNTERWNTKTAEDLNRAKSP